MKLSLAPVSRELQKRSFDCGHPALNEYFRHDAFRNDELAIGKTFVAVDDEGVVACYMTLATAQVEAQALPEERRMKLPRYPVPALRVAKLAVAKQRQGQGIGAWLLSRALERALSVSAEFGLYAVIVDAIDDQAKGFYEKYGFLPFVGAPLTLFLPIATIAAAGEEGSA